MNDALISRHASVNLLREVIMRNVPIDQVEENHLGDLPVRERRLARAITMTTLRHIGEISYLIDHFMEHPFDHDSIEKNIMRIGLAQLLYIDSIPSHAAIHGAVELAKEMDKERATGIINAILRRAQREAGEILDAKKRHLYNIPKWFQERIGKDYGKEPANAIMQNMLRGAKIDLRIRNLELVDEAFKTIYEDIIYNIPLHAETFRMKDRNVSPLSLEGWDEGYIYVQDVMSQTPAHFITGFGEGSKILDMCAAPGGKTIQLIDYNKGAEITACDVSENRIQRIVENFARCDTSCRIEQFDALEKNFEDETFDAILLDAPCSATGTSRRNPDVMVIRRKADVRQLVSMQSNMLDRANDALKKGGKLVYSTCSLLKDEGERQIASFIERHPDYEIIPATTDVINDESLITEEGFIRTTPDKNLDGFFVACLRKKA